MVNKDDRKKARRCGRPEHCSPSLKKKYLTEKEPENCVSNVMKESNNIYQHFQMLVLSEGNLILTIFLWKLQVLSCSTERSKNWYLQSLSIIFLLGRHIIPQTLKATSSLKLISKDLE